MGMFDDLKSRKEIEKLEREVKESPSPNALSNLAEKYLVIGDQDNALNLMKEAIEKFPDSERVILTYQHIMRVILQNRISELQKEVSSRPTPHGYVKLATLYQKDLNDIDTALEISRKGLSMFPENEDLHYINAVIRCIRFKEHYLAKDALKALEHLEFNTKKNPNNYKSRVLLVRLYIETGCISKAEKVLNELITLAPEDEKAKLALQKIQSIKTSNEYKEITDIEEHLKKIEENEALPEIAKLFDKLFEDITTEKDLTRISTKQILWDKDEMNNLLKKHFQTNVTSAVLFDKSGNVIASLSNEKTITQDFVVLLKDAYEAFENSSKKMDFGSFTEGVLDSDSGDLIMIDLRHGVLVLLAKSGVKKDQLYQSIESYVSSLSQ